MQPRTVRDRRLIGRRAGRLIGWSLASCWPAIMLPVLAGEPASSSSPEGCPRFERARAGDWSIAASPGAFAAERSGPPPADVQTHQDEFGRRGSRWGTIGAGVSHDFDGSTDIDAYFQYSNFLADDFQFAGELALWHFNQPGDNALGVNASMVFRYHFIHRETWTLYADLGMGIMLTTDNVPQEGTGFDLTPRIGGGITYELSPTLRLEVGLRWAHVSNARILGDHHNPARDSPMIYAGIIFPF